MNIAVQATALRNAAGETPLGTGERVFLNSQGETFLHPSQSYQNASTRIGVLALDNGKWLAMPPGFKVDGRQHDSRDHALRAGIAAMIRRSRKYMRAGEGEGTHWNEGFGNRIIEWALSLKPAKGEPLGKQSLSNAEDGPVREAGLHGGSPVAADASLAGALKQGNANDPIVRALAEANRARTIYPAGHTFSMTNPIINGQMVTMGTCSCGESFQYTWGSYELMDAAIEAHRRKFDHLPEKVDGRGNPIVADEYLAGITAKTEARIAGSKPRKRKAKQISGEERASASTEQTSRDDSAGDLPNAGEVRDLANAPLPEPSSVALSAGGDGSTPSDIAGIAPMVPRSEPAPNPSLPGGAGSTLILSDAGGPPPSAEGPAPGVSSLSPGAGEISAGQICPASDDDDLAIEWPSYDGFLEDKVVVAPMRGIEVPRDALHPWLKPHCKDLVVWALRLGCAAIFANFGLHKTAMQLEWCRQLQRRCGGVTLNVLPLGVRHGFIKEALELGMDVRFVRTNEEMAALAGDGVVHFLTNYESIRDGKLDPNRFTAVSLDEASVLRSYGSKTFQEFLPLFAKVTFKLVATATPSPNRYKELIHYSGFLGVMDTGLALTRFFQRNSEKAGDLTLYPHKTEEFWMWMHSWAAFLQRPSELGYSDEGYELPPLTIRWHEVAADHSKAEPERDGQGVMFRKGAASLQDAARSRRDSLPARVDKMLELLAQDPESHRILWHDLEAEREAIEAVVPGVVAITGSGMDIDERERHLHDFEEGRTKYFATKPILSGSGSNFQYHCHKAVYVGLPGEGYKFNDWIQSIYRLQRFGQTFPVEIDIIYSEDMRAGRAALEEKWALDTAMRVHMSEIIKQHGLNSLPLRDALLRKMGIARVEITSKSVNDVGEPLWRAINNDAVAEARAWPDNSVDEIITSIPFSNHYEYSACYDEQTEVLTRRGWLSFGAITTDDALATLNPDSGEVEWQAPSAITWHAYSGPMLHFKGRNSHDLLVTPNHKMFVDTRVGNRVTGRKFRKFELVRADRVEETFAPRKYVMTAAGRGKDGGLCPAYIDIPAVKQRMMPHSKVLSRIEAADFMRLAGWYLSEGHCYKPAGRRYIGRITIAQSGEANPTFRQEIIDLLRRIGLTPREEKSNVNIAVWSIPLAEFLRDQFGAGSYVKRIPRWVKDLHPDLLRIMRDTMMKGNGTKTGYSYASHSPRLRDDFQEICLLTGWRSCVNIKNNSVWIGQTNLFPEIRERPERVHYSGMIGCATVPNHTLIVRRNGKAIVCGNSYRDFGHTDDNGHFWSQMDFLTAELLRMLKPGRLACIHVKDRVLFGAVTGEGVPTISPFHAEAIMHYRAHGFQYMGMITVVTDVVRENNQTYRLGWSENAKDSTKMGVGSPEYVLLLRKRQSDRTRSYADVPVTKVKPDLFTSDEEGYSRARWQIDAHSYWRSNGNTLLTPEEFASLDAAGHAKFFSKISAERVYDYEAHVRIGEALERQGTLPATFMSIAPGSHHGDVWHDVQRMRTLNMMQARKGQEAHLCLARGSRVLTRRAGFVPIESVEIGDEVLTHRGRWRPVTVKANTGVRPVVTVKAQGVPGLTLTPDHKLWTRKVTGGKWAENHSRRQAANTDPWWVEAADTVGSYINLKLPPSEAIETESLLFWWTVGRWLADGHYSTAGSFVISCGGHEVEGLQQTLGPYAGKFRDTGTAFQAILRDPTKKLFKVLRACGRGAGGKHLPPAALTLPVMQADALLSGYLSGDGHFLEERQRWMATSVSRDLILGIALLVQRVHDTIATIYSGRKPGTAFIQGRKVTTRQEWILSFDLPHPERRKGLPFLMDDGAWKKVRSVEPAGEVETWCLRVAEDESFTAEGCIVKNCPLQFDIVDRLIERYSNEGELIFDPFGGLMTVPYRALLKGRRGVATELSATYFMDGVHYLGMAEEQMATPTLFDLKEFDAANYPPPQRT